MEPCVLRIPTEFLPLNKGGGRYTEVGRLTQTARTKEVCASNPSGRTILIDKNKGDKKQSDLKQVTACRQFTQKVRVI